MSIEIKTQVPLADFTTLKIGGEARLFVEVSTEDQIIETVQFAKQNDLDIFVLGGGSNCLISDNGFDGVVLKIALKGVQFNENKVIAQAGEDWDEFVKLCVDKQLQGIECLSGIPGLVGGTPVQNVGAYGQEVSETIEMVRVFDRKSHQILELNNQYCKFSYRKSIFNSTETNRFIVVSVTFILSENGTPKLVYKDLKEYFNGKIANLAETRDAVCEIRAKKAMLVRQKGKDSQSVGSFFKNPIVLNDKLIEIEKVSKKVVPNFKFDDENVKIPAAWLIEQSGFKKGYKLGNAGLSTKHTLALTNRGDAKATDILALKSEIQAKVKTKFGIELNPEPIFIGF